MVVTKPATQRPRLPSVGRLGLVDPQAAERIAQLGWHDHDDQAHVDLLPKYTDKNMNDVLAYLQSFK